MPFDLRPLPMETIPAGCQCRLNFVPSTVLAFRASDLNKGQNQLLTFDGQVTEIQGGTPSEPVPRRCLTGRIMNLWEIVTPGRNPGSATNTHLVHRDKGFSLRWP